MATFLDVVTRRLRAAAEQPFLTFYDHASGERVELSMTTYANWVAKVAGLLAEECDAERGQTLRADLPAHWLGPVVLGAAWSIGMGLTEAESPDVVVCGPQALEHWSRAASAPGGPRVVACSLLPMATRFAEPVPDGVIDLGVEVWAQPDAFTPWDPPTDDDLATDDRTQGEIVRAAAAGSLLTDGGRLVTTANPASPPELAVLTEPLVRGGSMVLVARPDPARMEETCSAERVTHRA